MPPLILKGPLLGNLWELLENWQGPRRVEEIKGGLHLQAEKEMDLGNYRPTELQLGKVLR